MSSPYNIVACLIAGVLGTAAVWLVITGSRPAPAIPPVIMPSFHRVPAACGGPAGSWIIDPPSITRDLSVDRKPA
jgi:hypothetical protein